MREFLEAALRVVEHAARAHGVPTVAVQRVDFAKKGGLSAAWYDEPAYRMMLNRLRTRLMAMSETAAVVNVILETKLIRLPRIVDRSGAPIVPSRDQAASLVYDRLYGFLAGWLEDTQSVAIADAEFERHATDFMATWGGAEVVHRVTVPLLNFRSDSLPIDLGAETRIEALDASAKAALWQHGILDQPFVSASQMAATEAALTATYRTDDATHTSANETDDVIEAAVLAMRLLKPGAVIPAAKYDRVVSLQVGPSFGASLRESWRPLPRRPSIYDLSREDVWPFRQLFEAIRRLQHSSGYADLHVAIRRFEQTYGRESREDQVIDLTIGLESTVLFGEKDELRYRLALRGACLLKETVDPSETFALLKRLYDLRSGIVHSGKTIAQLATRSGIGGRPVEEFLASAMEWYRQLLRYLIGRIDKGETLKAIVSAIDASVLDGLRPVALKEEMPPAFPVT